MSFNKDTMQQDDNQEESGSLTHKIKQLFNYVLDNRRSMKVQLFIQAMSMANVMASY